MNTAVSKLREALSDSAENSRYIETIPRRGYRFVALKTSQITSVPDSEDLHMPRWSPYGRYIAAIDGNRTKLMLFDISSQGWVKLAQSNSVSFPVGSADGADIFYQDMSAPGQPLYRVHLPSGSRAIVASFEKALAAGIVRCVFTGLSPSGAPMIAFDRSNSDIYGARLSLP